MRDLEGGFVKAFDLRKGLIRERFSGLGLGLGSGLVKVRVRYERYTF